MSNVGQLGFANQLKIPPLAEPRLDGAGRKVFDLRLQQGTSRFLDAKTTQTWVPTAPTWAPPFVPPTATRS
jgi:suppressor of ftsI